MRRITITENDFGSAKQYIVETSGGIRTTGASLASALDRLLQTSDPKFEGSIWDIPQDGRYAALKQIFEGIRDSGPSGQIHQGLQS